MSDMTYTEQVAAQNRRLDRIDDKLSALNVNVAALTEHVAQQNGRVEKVEKQLDRQGSEVVQLQVSAEGARVMREGNKNLGEMIRDNLWNIIQAVILAVILAEIGLGG